MTITPLNPSIPVVVTAKDNASAECIGWIDYSPEHDLLWICAMDEDGAVWIVPNNEIRVHANWSLGRRPRKIARDPMNIRTGLSHHPVGRMPEKV